MVKRSARIGEDQMPLRIQVADRRQAVRGFFAAALTDLTVTAKL